MAVEDLIPYNGITGWTAPLTEEQVAALPWNRGVVPAGGAFRLPGVDPETYRAWSEGYGPETADKVLREPIRQAEQAVGILEGLRGGVPDAEINRVKAGFNEAVSRIPPLVQAGMDANEADAMLLAPLRDQTKALASRYRYAEPSGLRTLTDVQSKKLSDLYQRRRDLERDLNDLTIDPATIKPKLDEVIREIAEIEGAPSAPPIMQPSPSPSRARRYNPQTRSFE